MKTEQIIYNRQNMVMEANGATGVTKGRYLRGTNLLAQEIDGVKYYYTFNAHGDVIQRICENGDSSPKYDYDAFGNQQTVNTDPNPFRYCGEYWDDETRLIYLRARYYDSKTGRFISEDTVHSTTNSMPNETEATDPLSLNLYNYCYNNPTKYIDPSGHFGLTLSLGVVIGVIGLAITVAALAYVLTNVLIETAKIVGNAVDDFLSWHRTACINPNGPVLTNHAAYSPTAPGYAAVSQAPHVAAQEQASFSYPAVKSYAKPDNGDKTEVKAEDLVGSISTPASPPPPDPNNGDNRTFREKYGHTLDHHGSGSRMTRSLRGRAGGTGQAQGQWLDNNKALEFLDSLGKVTKVSEFRLPKGLGQVILPNGQIIAAQYVRVIPSATGIKTAFPILQLNPIYPFFPL